MYKLEGVIFQYKPTSGEGGGSTNQLGKIIMATDYDPMALPFINSVQMENYQYSQSTKPSLAARHGVECAPAQGVTDMKYVRTGLSNRDKSFTDYGLFQLATEGIPISGLPGTVATANIGELWVSYRVRLSRANLYSSLLGYNIRNDLYVIDAGIAAAGQPVGLTIKNDVKNNNIGCIVRARAGTGFLSDSITVAFPVSQILGVYKITLQSYWNGTEVAGQYVWVPNLNAGGFTTAAADDGTKWGCPFTPIANYSEDDPVKPAIDLTTGEPRPQGSTFPYNWTGQRKLCYFTSEAQDGASPLQTTTSTYFAINAPTTTIAQLTFVLTTASNAVPCVMGTSINGQMFSTLSYHKIFIEQANAEISN